MDGTNESGKNSNEAKYIYVYRIPNTNIYYPSMVGGSNLRNKLVAVGINEVETREAEGWTHRENGMYYNYWYWSQLGDKPEGWSATDRLTPPDNHWSYHNKESQTQANSAYVKCWNPTSYHSKAIEEKGWDPDSIYCAPADWCAIFVTFCATFAGVQYHDRNAADVDGRGSSALENLDGYVYVSTGVGNIVDFHAKRGEWKITDRSYVNYGGYGSTSASHYDDSYIPLPGDIIIFDWSETGSYAHVGIVEYYDANEQKVHTIEGNSLGRKSYSYVPGAINGSIAGFVVPSYPISPFGSEDLTGTEAEPVWNELVSRHSSDLIDPTTETGRTPRGDVVHSALYAKRGDNRNGDNGGYLAYVLAVNEYCDPETCSYGHSRTAANYKRIYSDEQDGARTVLQKIINDGKIEFWDTGGGHYHWNINDIRKAIDAETSEDPIYWATDCCGYIRLVYALNGMGSHLDGSYVEPYTGSNVLTASTVLKPGDYIWTGTNHTLMFLYKDGSTYHFIDQSRFNFKTTGYWDSAAGALKISGDERLYTGYKSHF